MEGLVGIAAGFSPVDEEVEGRGDFGDGPFVAFEAFVFWGAGDEERSDVSGYPAEPLGEDPPSGEVGVKEGNDLVVGSDFAGAENVCVVAWFARVLTSAEGLDSNPAKTASNERDFVPSGAIVGSFGAEERLLKPSSVCVGAVEPLAFVVSGKLTGLAGAGAEVFGDEKSKKSPKVAPAVNGWPSETRFEAPTPLRVGIDFRASSNADIPVLSAAAEGIVVDVPVKEGSNGLVDSLNVSKVLATL